MTKNSITRHIHSEQDTKKIAHIIAHSLEATLDNNVIFYLEGDLGAGKTTFTRYFLHSLGYLGKVKSPTYTLIEHYDIGNHNIYHLDLYRLVDQEELNFLGLDDYLATNKSIFMIEWADKANKLLPEPDIILKLFADCVSPESRMIEVVINPNNSAASVIWNNLQKID